MVIQFKTIFYNIKEVIKIIASQQQKKTGEKEYYEMMIIQGRYLD